MPGDAVGSQRGRCWVCRGAAPDPRTFLNIHVQKFSDLSELLTFRATSEGLVGPLAFICELCFLAFLNMRFKKRTKFRNGGSEIEVQKTKFRKPVRTACVDFICELPAYSQNHPANLQISQVFVEPADYSCSPTVLHPSESMLFPSSIGVRSDLWHSHMPSSLCAKRGATWAKGCVITQGGWVARCTRTSNAFFPTARVWKRKERFSYEHAPVPLADFIPGCREPFLELSSRV